MPDVERGRLRPGLVAMQRRCIGPSAAEFKGTGECFQLRGAAQSEARLIGRGRDVKLCPELAEKELKGKRVQYVGEEVGVCHPLSLEQVRPALPPEEYGGSIELTRFLSASSRNYLFHPQKNLVKDVGQTLPKLQGKVHVQGDDMDEIASELVRRGVCRWIPLEDVLVYRKQRVLNGLFGVEKSGEVGMGKPLRLIMNLVPSYSVIKGFQGRVKTLPRITSWMSVVTEEGEEVRVWQSDMSNAFYLFQIPDSWSPLLSFNVIRTGRQLGLEQQGDFALACAVLPMGWANSVAFMQGASEHILLRGNLSTNSQISRGSFLPPWVSGLVSESHQQGKAFWHVYLDNFAAGEVGAQGSSFETGNELHRLAEDAWAEAKVVSSAKKRRVAEAQAQELGAHIDGVEQTIG